MTTDCSAVERTLTSALGGLRPVAVAYLEAPPEGVASDHFNCPIGSYTHAIDLPRERTAELEQTLSLMTWRRTSAAPTPARWRS